MYNIRIDDWAVITLKCSELFTIRALSELKLISGADGLSNSIRWVYKPETSDYSRWVTGGELIFLSISLAHSKGFNLRTFVKEAINAKMSGLVIPLGNEGLETIGSDIVDLSNSAAFPIFSLPWNLPLLDVFQEVGRRIAYDEVRSKETNDFLTSIIFGGNISRERILSEAEKCGADLSVPQRIFVIRHYSINEDFQLLEAVKKYFSDTKIAHLVSYYSNNIIGMIPDFDGCKDIFFALAEQLESFGADFEIGVGSACEKAEQLSDGFREAVESIKLGARKRSARRVMFYEELGFYRMLFNMDEQELRRYVDGVLGSLIRYDEKKQTELLHTLEVYIENMCSFTAAADVLHTHKNTVKYRISRIEEMLGISLGDIHSVMEIYTALMIWEYFN